ncbi:MAG: DUF6288 domain-containing protein [Lentisphaeria bacterium]|nr:DUF6288 domain-containing protein [Lentisphaeria bacterium]
MIKLRQLVFLTVMALVFSVSCDLFALELSRYFGSDMVLQRDKPVVIWGKAKPGDEVTVDFADQSARATTDKDGRWTVTLKAMKASAKPQKLSVHSTLDTRPSTLDNVVVGDVFLFARQSSIDVSLGTKAEGRKAAENIKPDQTFRFIHIKAAQAKDPQDDLKQEMTKGWETLDKTSALTMSAAAFYLGCDLVKHIEVPLGIVDLDMGYHFPISWLSERGLDLAETRPGTGLGDLKWYREDMPKRIAEWEKQQVAKEDDKSQGLDLSPLEYPYYPSSSYNAVIHPLQGLALKGMLLQLGNDYQMVFYTFLERQGKSTDREALERAWNPTYMIMKKVNRMTPLVLPVAPEDLRQSLGDSSLPIAWIMPPGSDVYDFAIHNREVREIQRRTQGEFKGIDLILPGAEHIPLSGQPADDALVAKRCAQWVMGTFYETNQPASGPIFERFEYHGGKGIVHFKPGTATGLTAKGDALDHFEVAMADGKFVPCKARIVGETVRLSSEEVPAIVFARYNWSRKPAQGLMNSAGLPALPFTTDAKWEYDWWPATAPVELPAEYHTTANKWPDRDVAIVNLANQLAGGDSQHNPNHLGPTGLSTATFGPNLYVHAIDAGSPADGKVFPDDIIYGVNGKAFTSPGSYRYNGTTIDPDSMYRQFSAAITMAESEEGGGKMVLNIRRKGKLIEVPLQLEVLGSYSSITPFHCEKSKRIVEKAEEWMRSGMRPAEGFPQYANTLPFHTDFLFLMGSGNPELQGVVRRYVYSLLAAKESQIDYSQEVKPGGSMWAIAYDALLMGEYYHQTGDASVLPYLKYLTTKIWLQQYRPPGSDLTKHAVATDDQQTGGFYPGWHAPMFPGIGRTTYGLMAASGMPAIMSLILAQEAGVEIEPLALERGLRHFNYKRAEYGYVLYARRGRIEKPFPIVPEAEANGMVWSMNGKLGTAAALFNMVDGYPDTVEICSRYCVYGFNNTRSGHGGMFFNNFWTPIGAHLAGEKGFQHFMKGQTWWRELYRNHDGSFTQAGRGGIGVAYALHRVAQHKRLRILGSPHSAFGPDAPAYLKPALDAHRKRDYALAETLIQKELAERVIPTEELPTVRHFLESVQTLGKSIAYDLAYTEDLIKQGKYYLASLELPQLKGVVAADNPELQAIVAVLESPEGEARIASTLEAIKQNTPKKVWPDKAEELAKRQKGWTTVIKDGMEGVGRDSLPQFPEGEWSRWRIKVLETSDHAQEGWFKPKFDDSDWAETTLPNIWRPGHAALLRTTFEINDKAACDAVRIRANLRKQRDVVVYINGHLVAKINNEGNAGNIPLTDYALEVMKKGTNTLAIVTHNHKRPYDLGFRLEVHQK